MPPNGLRAPVAEARFSKAGPPSIRCAHSIEMRIKMTSGAGLQQEMLGAVMVLTLDNERALNALTPGIMQALDDAAASIERTAEVRAVVLTGTGNRAFSAGADIKAWGDLDQFAFARDWIRNGHRVFDRIARLPVPTVAALNGHAFGGGLELAACCDIRIAVRPALLALPEASIGITPGWSGTQRVARQLPAAVVRDMALFGARISAERAYQLGFLTEVVEGDVLTRAVELAERTVALAPRAVEIVKLMLGVESGEGREAAIDAMASGFAASTRDRAEGVASFREKRPPKFEGR
jgi:enoyl-CoA hydratase